MNTAGSPDNHIVGANGIPKDVWVHLDDLLCISWGSLGDQIDCSSRIVRQPRWILKQLCNTDLEVNADKFNILCTSTEYLEVLANKRPQSNKAQTQLRFNCPKGVITRHFHGMVEHYRDHWARRNDCLPLSPWVWSDLSNQIKGIIVCPTSGIRCIKEHSIT